MDKNDLIQALMETESEDISEAIIQIFIQLYLDEQTNQEI